MKVLQTIPILRIFSVEKAKEFYVDFLGFKIDWEHRFDEKAPLYMQISRDGCVLHLSEHYGDCCPGSTVFLRVSGMEEYHRAISAKGYGYLRPGIERTFHNSKCMEVIDPFGNRIRFDESLVPAS
ncbi:MAG TPA: glyoxalase superfamily protein [Gemmataceae bacterium]|jgi:uncharacterized glyoxalase superfamily protein PhnB|nr:glyoxalase superfamily protein [Gemmataceae bacterium]